MVEEEEEELLPQQTSIGHYQLKRRIGSGGMGDVYAAEHTALGKRVAIKVLRRRFLDDDTVVARFIREGKLAARLRHPNIVDVTDAAVLDGVPCLVMEMLEGEALSDRIARDGAIPANELVDLVLPIVAALEHAHGEGVLHRDLKPANVFLARAWNAEVVPKLVDFGISKSLGESPSSALTNDTFIGTPRYAAPEIISGEQATTKSDQYAIGLVLYEAATGQKPFGAVGASIMNLARAIASGDLPKPRELAPGIPEELERIIRRAMAVLPADRYPSMRELGAALLPLASPRVRTIWAPVFADAEPLLKTGETNVVHGHSSGLRAAANGSSLGGVSVPNVPPAAPAGRGQTVVIPPKAPPRSDSSIGQVAPAGGTVVIPPQLRTPRSGSHAYGVPTPSVVAIAAPRSTPKPPARLPVVPLAIGGVVLAGCLLLVVGFARKGTRPDAEANAAESATATATVAPRAPFVVRVSAVPDTATFEIDGARVGTGSVTRSFPRDGAHHMLRIQAPGYRPISISFDEASPPPPSVVLQPFDDEAPPASADEASPAAPRPRSNTAPAHPRTRTDNIDPWSR